MSCSASVLVQEGISIEELAQYIGAWAGLPLVRVNEAEWPLYQAELAGVELSVFDCDGFEDDSGIAFNSYAYVVDLVLLRSCVEYELQRSLQLSLAKAIGSLVATRFQCGCLVVDNMQTAVAAFGPSDAERLR